MNIAMRLKDIEKKLKDQDEAIESLLKEIKRKQPVLKFFRRKK